MANPRRAIDELLEVCDCLTGEPPELLILNASMGHPLSRLYERVHEVLPTTAVVAGSCAGVVGREGVSETLNDVAMMAVRGKEVAAVHVDDIYGHNALEKSRSLAEALRAANPDAQLIYLLVSGIDINNDEVLQAFEAEFGPRVTLFGATTSDNMLGLKSFQMHNGQLLEHGAVAVGFSDPDLEAYTCASHGFIATGEPMVVTSASGIRIFELDGQPAWQRYLECLGLPPDAKLSDSIPIGAVAEELDAARAKAYGNSHILRVVTQVEGEGVMLYPADIREGTRLWLTERDEDRIFSDLERMTSELQGFAGERKPVAVFQADCLARGRRLFNRIIKEELVERMQHPFRDASGTPPWLGMYGFGEYAKLSGRNAYHNYTTALAALYRKS
ncbi:MAG: hypothetical protein Cons2KO_16180 [Congregibacter sp.]